MGCEAGTCRWGWNPLSLELGPPQCGTGVSRAGDTWLGDSLGVGEGFPHYGAETPQCGAGKPRSGNGTARIRVWGWTPPPTWELGGLGMWMGLPRDRDAGLGPLSVGLGSPRDWGEGLGFLGTGMGSPGVGLGLPED